MITLTEVHLLWYIGRIRITYIETSFYSPNAEAYEGYELTIIILLTVRSDRVIKWVI